MEMFRYKSQNYDSGIFSAKGIDYE